MESASTTGVLAAFDRQVVEQGIADHPLVRRVRAGLAGRLPEGTSSLTPQEAGRHAAAVLDEIASLPEADPGSVEELALLRARLRQLRDEAEAPVWVDNASGRQLLRALVRPRGRSGRRG